MKTIKISTLVLALSLTYGCATLVKGTTQDISITTDPPEACVLVDSQGTYKSPTKIAMSRKENHSVKITKEGYQEELILITSSLGAMTFGNILFGGIGGAVVDGVTGASNNLSPEIIDIKLKPVQ